MRSRFAVLFACIVINGCASAPDTLPALATETLMIPALDDGIKLHIRNKRLATHGIFPPERVLLMVHGSVVSSETVFDFELPGGSWMDYAAHRGFDVYIVDIRGFGRSTRPVAMDRPPEESPPFVNSAVAIRDITVAVDFILARNNVSRINLLGWSWGASLMAGYAAQNPDKVGRLVLLAPVWPPLSETSRTAYRTVNLSSAPRNIPAERLDEIFPTESFRKYQAGILATDPVGAARTPPGIRVPNLGPINAESAVGKTPFDPGAVRAPTLVIVGEWDGTTPPAMAQELFKKLTGATYRRLIVFSEGAHAAMVQSNRMHLIREIQHFLEEPER